ncbi:MAG: N-acetylneuraminate synthase, partial [Kordiimonadaceae bacterium]|nr:N-acetylneuraminate synthase [Kordiimonadaceae bacterium]
MKSIQILDKKIGREHPVYFIADIAANHDGDLQRAKDLIYRAAEAGANAAKFQNFRAETIVSDLGFRALGDKFSHQAKWEKSVFDVYKAASLPLEWTPVLNETCIDAGIHYFTAPYEIEMVAGLSEYVCAWKIGSGDITWIEHIKNIARLGKPVMLATGAAGWDDVQRAVTAVFSETNNLVLMQCNTNYTGSRENFRYIGLNVLKEYAREFPEAILGLSDHTPGHTTVLGAVTLGARVIEKHFTDNVEREGPDHAFSMDPISWRHMVLATEDLDAALGDTKKRVMENERETVILQRRAVRAGRKISAGEEVSKDMLVCLRPCPTDGIPPFQDELIIGRRVKK